MSEPIRVLHILQRMEAGGIQSFLMNLYRCIDRKRIQFDFLVQYKEDEFYDKEIYSLGGKIYKFSVREDYNIVKYKSQLRQFFKEHKEYKIVHGHMETLSNIWEKEAARSGIQCLIVHSHTAGFNEKNPVKLLVKKFFRSNYGKYANYHFACSNAAGKFMFPNKKFEMIPNAININRFRFSEELREIRNELGIESNFVIGHVGRFHPSKNHIYILDIIQELKKTMHNIKVLFIGDGDLKKNIENEVKVRGLKDEVLFLGSRSDVNSLYSAMDVFIMPSLYEGLPLTGVEAQASGLTCLFSDTITSELKITDLANFLSLEDGPQAWSNKLISVSNNIIDRTKYAELVAEKGYDINFLAEKLTLKYESFYMESNRD